MILSFFLPKSLFNVNFSLHVLYIYHWDANKKTGDTNVTETKSKTSAMLRFKLLLKSINKTENTSYLKCAQSLYLILFFLILTEHNNKGDPL